MNQDIFKETVFILKDEMFRFAKRMLANADDAQDLTQDLMLRFWTKRNELDNINVRAYALRCIRNECVNRIRHKAVKRKHIGETLSDISIYQPETSNLKDIIEKFINDLPEKQRLAIHFKDVEGYDVPEISKLLNVAQSSVRANIMRARQKVKKQIKQLMDYETGQISR